MPNGTYGGVRGARNYPLLDYCHEKHDRLRGEKAIISAIKRNVTILLQ